MKKSNLSVLKLQYGCVLNFFLNFFITSLDINYISLRVYNIQVFQVFFNLLLSYHSDVQNLDLDCRPPVEVVITTVTVNFTKINFEVSN